MLNCPFPVSLLLTCCVCVVFFAFSLCMRQETDGIRARWEWRIFDRDLSGPAQIFNNKHHETVQKSKEIYIVSKSCTDNIKIRNNTLDIKRLLSVNKTQFEQWSPILKVLFPLKSQDVAFLCNILSIPLNSVMPYSATVNGLIQYLNSIPSIECIQVEKNRYRYIINSCMAEYSQVIFNGTPYETIALEHTDEKRLHETYRELGWVNLPNINYLSALKRFLENAESGVNKNGH